MSSLSSSVAIYIIDNLFRLNNSMHGYLATRKMFHVVIRNYIIYIFTLTDYCLLQRLFISPLKTHVSLSLKPRASHYLYGNKVPKVMLTLAPAICDAAADIRQSQRPT